MGSEYVHPDGRLSLWPNRKRAGKRDPDIRGTGTYRGEQVRLSLWLEQKGGPHYEGTIQPMAEPAPDRTQAAETPALLGEEPAAPGDGGIPF